jgi:hypothetical protein
VVWWHDSEEALQEHDLGAQLVDLFWLLPVLPADSQDQTFQVLMDCAALVGGALLPSHFLPLESGGNPLQDDLEIVFAGCDLVRSEGCGRTTSASCISGSETSCRECPRGTALLLMSALALSDLARMLKMVAMKATSGPRGYGAIRHQAPVGGWRSPLTVPLIDN